MNIQALIQPYNQQRIPETIGVKVAAWLQSAEFSQIWLVSAFISESAVAGFRASLQVAQERGAAVRCVVGIDQNGTDMAALDILLKLNIETYIWHNPQRQHIFHPKIYLFEAPHETAHLLMGSSNFTQGGLFNNYEAMLWLQFDLTLPTEAEQYITLKQSLAVYLNPQGPTVQRLTPDLLEMLTNEGAVARPKPRHRAAPSPSPQPPTPLSPFKAEPIAPIPIEFQPINDSGDLPMMQPATPEQLAQLRQHFPQKADDQLQDWFTTAAGLDELENLAPKLLLDSAERGKFNDNIQRARSLLDIERPYTISIVGATGAGKSGLVNALVGDNLLSSRDSAEAITGTIVSVNQAVPTESDLPDRKATIHYYNQADLKALVNDYCADLGFSPVLDQNKLDVVKTQAKLNERSSDDPKYQALHDLLTVAHRHQRKIDDGQEVFPLNTPEDLAGLRDLMDEQSKLNQLGSKDRLIPLIDRIEIELASPELAEEGLFNVKWVDVPGTRASIARHDQRVRDQLSPTNTDAILLVLARGERFVEGGQELLDRMNRVIMGDLDNPHQRLNAASRIFLVVNKGDIHWSDNALNDGLNKICATISPDYRYNHGANIFPAIKARPAMLAQLQKEYPDEGQRWLNNGQAEGPFADFDPKLPEEYNNNIRKATAEYPDLPPHEAVWQWSDVPALKARLADFLRDSRFEHDLQEAKERYKAAYNLALDTTTAKWREIFQAAPGDNPAETLQARLDNRAIAYVQHVNQQAQQIKERFDKAQNALKNQAREQENCLLHKPLLGLKDKLLTKISTYTQQPEFQRNIINLGGDMGFLVYDFGSVGDLTTLKQLDLQIFQWLDGLVDQVTDTFIDLLEKQVAHQKVLAFLEGVQHHSPKAKTFLTRYQTEVMQELHRSYHDGCRGAFFCQLRGYNVVRKIAEAVSNFGNPVDNRKSGEVEKLVVNATNSEYEKALEILTTTICPQLVQLFYYQLVVVANKLYQLADEIQANLAIEAMKPDSLLYQYYQSQSAHEIKLAYQLVEILEHLPTLPRVP